MQPYREPHRQSVDDLNPKADLQRKQFEAYALRGGSGRGWGGLGHF